MLRSVGTWRTTNVMRSAKVIAASRRIRLSSPGLDERPLRSADTTTEESLWKTSRHRRVRDAQLAQRTPVTTAVSSFGLMWASRALP